MNRFLQFVWARMSFSVSRMDAVGMLLLYLNSFSISLNFSHIRFEENLSANL